MVQSCKWWESGVHQDHGTYDYTSITNYGNIVLNTHTNNRYRQQIKQNKNQIKDNFLRVQCSLSNNHGEMHLVTEIAAAVNNWTTVHQQYKISIN